MADKQPRKRITKTGGVPALVDPMEYTANKCSENVRSVSTLEETIEIKLYYDKHYISRNQHGDTNGKRDGIGESVVKRLVTKSIKHLMFYSTCVERFRFLNHETRENKTRAIRVICVEDTPSGRLNIAIEAHTLGLNKFEITVVTAMCVDDFAISDGQYVIEFFNDGSTLKKMENKNLREILSI